MASPPWTRIDTVLLDMDGTLLDLRFDNHFWLEHLPARWAEVHGREPVAARAELLRPAAAGTGEFVAWVHLRGGAHVTFRAAGKQFPAQVGTPLLRSDVVEVPAGETSLEGQWTALGSFRVRTALTTPRLGGAWLLIEVYAETARQDFRILSSQTVESPFGTGRVEIVEPRLGRSLTYVCKEDHP